MSSYLARLVGRHLDPSPTLRPRRPSRYEGARPGSAGGPGEPGLELEESPDGGPTRRGPIEPPTPSTAARSIDDPGRAADPARAGDPDQRARRARSSLQDADHRHDGPEAAATPPPPADRAGHPSRPQIAAGRVAIESAPAGQPLAVRPSAPDPGAAPAQTVDRLDRPGEPDGRLTPRAPRSADAPPGQLRRPRPDQPSAATPGRGPIVSRRQPPPAPVRPDVVQVRIGRIEVRAIVERPAAAIGPRPSRQAAAAGPLPLDRYLAGERRS